jgi:hypothetical protein
MTAGPPGTGGDARDADADADAIDPPPPAGLIAVADRREPGAIAFEVARPWALSGALVAVAAVIAAVGELVAGAAIAAGAALIQLRNPLRRRLVFSATRVAGWPLVDVLGCEVHRHLGHEIVLHLRPAPLRPRRVRVFTGSPIHGAWIAARIEAALARRDRAAPRAAPASGRPVRPVP